MDIDLLSKMVKELILDDDKVVLPGLGCFVAEIVPAYFSDKGYTINPPYRKLYFRSRPDEGEALIDFYAKSNDVAYDVAEKIVKDFVAELRTVLMAKKVVVFPALGRLRATKENNVFFIADEDLDIYPEGFGLEPISLKTHQETAEEVSVAVAGLKTMLDQQPAAPEPIPVVAEPAPVVPQPVAAEPAVPEPVVPEISVPEQEPVPELPAEPEILVEPAEEPVAVEPQPQKTEASRKAEVNWSRILLIILAVFAGLVVAYMAVGRLCPEWIDQFLYTPEELEILNR